MKRSILIIDDDPATRFGFSRSLSKGGYDIKEASSLAEAREVISSQRFDAVILDQLLPDGNGIDWIHDIRGSYPDIAIVIITGAGDIPIAVEAMRRGADHFLTKPVNMAELDVFLQKSLELGALRRQNLTRQRLLKRIEPYFGESESTKKVKEHASLAFENDSTVLLLGETGTGKGVLAKWIHEHSLRSTGPFVDVNCSNLRGELLASELFGHAKGAFTSADRDQQGLIEFADGGTLFLDEIGDMDYALQTQMLKVIEEKSYRRLGEVRARKSNFRLICATNKNLVEEVERGRFRQDLYFRIQILPLRMPPLRETLEDLPGLVNYILRILQAPHPGVSPEVLSVLKTYAWPGNIRELKNVLERALLFAKGDPLGPEHILGSSLFHITNPEQGEIHNLDELEVNYIKSVIERSGGDLEKAAEALGMSRATLYRKLKKARKSG